MNTHQKGFASVLIILAVLFVGAAVYFGFMQKSGTTTESPASVPTQNNNIPTASGKDTSWKTYTNTQYAFQMQYPPTWKVENNLLSFTTKNGRAATLYLLGTAQFDGPTQSVSIGSEQGTEWAGILCEQERPCAAVFKYHSSALDNRGFSFHLAITNVDSDFDRSPGSPDYQNPRPIFSDDIATVRQVLSTLTFTQ